MKDFLLRCFGVYFLEVSITVYKWLGKNSFTDFLLVMSYLFFHLSSLGLLDTIEIFKIEFLRRGDITQEDIDCIEVSDEELESLTGRLKEIISQEEMRTR